MTTTFQSLDEFCTNTGAIIHPNFKDNSNTLLKVLNGNFNTLEEEETPAVHYGYGLYFKYLCKDNEMAKRQYEAAGLEYHPLEPKRKIRRLPFQYISDFVKDISEIEHHITIF